MFNGGLRTHNMKYARIPMGEEGSLEPTEDFNKYRFAQVWMNDQTQRLLKKPLSPVQVYEQMRLLGFGELAESPDGRFSEQALLDFVTTSARDVFEWKQRVRGYELKNGEWVDTRTSNTDPGKLSPMKGEKIEDYGHRVGEIAGRPSLRDRPKQEEHPWTPDWYVGE